MNPTNLTEILTLRVNPTQLNPILDPGSVTLPKNCSGRVQIRLIKYIIGLNPNLNPFLDPEGQLFPFESKNLVQNWVESGRVWLQ